MRISQIFLPTLREAPSDADIISTTLMFRAGMIRKIASGIYEWLPLGLRVLKKVEHIIREEMNAAEGQEVWLPLVVPKELWQETGRWDVYGKELLRFKDRKGADFCLGPTHEEVITDLVRNEVRSYRNLPLMLYQFGTKFRDEIRPRFGVMRAREFYMKDAYSFHADEKDAERYYQAMFDAYKKICERCGFKYRAVEATTGAIGGSFSHEFMVLAESGEEEIVSCVCGYGANTEKAEVPKKNAPLAKEEAKGLEVVDTPGLKTVEEVSGFLKAGSETFIKTLIYAADGVPVVALVRGDYEINEHKLAGVLNASVLALADENLIEKVTGAPLGFAGPVGLKDANVRIIADYSLADIANAVSGANKKDYHFRNINPQRDIARATYADIRVVKRGDRCPKCGAGLQFSRGIEVGHTFKLGLKYSRSMKASYLDQEGKENLMVMGCYGIGVSRIVAATIEQSNDENGIIWPMALAPYQVIIVPINWNDENTRKVSEQLYRDLLAQGIETLLDDRAERAGMKFKDADLIGIPLRITVGERNLAENKVELKARWEKKEASRLIELPAVLTATAELIRHSTQG